MQICLGFVGNLEYMIVQSMLNFGSLINKNNDIGMKSFGCVYIYIYIYNHIRYHHHHHHYVAPSAQISLTFSCQSLLGGPPGYILYWHRAIVCRFQLVVLSLLVHVRGSTGVCHLWVPPYFSSSVLHVWFV